MSFGSDPKDLKFYIVQEYVTTRVSVLAGKKKKTLFVDSAIGD